MRLHCDSLLYILYLYISTCAHFVLSFTWIQVFFLLFFIHSIVWNMHAVCVYRQLHTASITVCLSHWYTAVMDDGWFQDTNHQHFSEGALAAFTLAAVAPCFILLFPSCNTQTCLCVCVCLSGRVSFSPTFPCLTDLHHRFFALVIIRQPEFYAATARVKG